MKTANKCILDEKTSNLLKTLGRFSHDLSVEELEMEKEAFIYLDNIVGRKQTDKLIWETTEILKGKGEYRHGI